MSRQIEGVSIVIPAHNEEKGLKKTLEECAGALEKLNGIAYEIVVVDDGSTDDTAQIARDAGVVIVSHPSNGGYGFSLKDGINAAKYDAVIITDADGTYPVKDIPVLIEQYRKGFDMVVGARTGANYRQSFLKSVLRRILKFMVEWACGKRIDDINSGFRIFSKAEAQNYYFHLCDTFSFTTSITLAYMMTGKFVSYIPTEYYQRDGSSHVRIFRDSIRTITYVMKQILYFDPLKIFFLFAVAWVSLGVLALVLSAVFGLKFGYYVLILSVFGFFVMLGLGLIAEQLRQVIGVEKASQNRDGQWK